MKNTFHLLLISLLLVSACGLHAQETPRTPVTPVTPVEPDLEQPEESIGTLILSDDSALQVLDLLEQLTGKIILRRQDISPAKINFNSRGKISKRDAVLALESLLTLNGIMLTDMGDRFMKAVPATDVNRHVPEMLVGSTLGLDTSQKIYAKLFKLDYLNAEQISGTLIQPLLSQNSSFLPFPKSNALLITDALINLQRIESILAEADQPESLRETVKFIKLDYIQATDAQNQIEKLIQGPLKSYLEGNTSVSSDERTNQLILVTHPGNVDMIMDVIKNIDVDAAPLTGSEVFQLRQAKAEEVVPIIKEIIDGQKQGREKDAEVARDNERRNSPNPIPGRPPNPLGPNPGSGAATATSDANASLQFSNFVGLSADERTNAIVAYGTQQDLKTLKELIEKIDIPLPQVVIEAIITEVNLTENQASGLSNFGFKYDGSTNIFSGINIQVPGIGITEGEVDLNNPSNFKLSAVIESAEGDSNVRILSTPRIVVSHNEEGIINVSQSRPIITGSTSSGISDNLNTRSTIEFRDIGIQLTVTPLIGADGTVQMEIEQTVENVVETTEIDGNDQPIIGKREATSTISVMDGQVIILGGLQENSATDSNNYWPFLGRLPGIGSFFGEDSNEFRRTELIIFIRPTVLSNPAIAETVSKDYVEGASEKEALTGFLESGSLNDTYMEGSRFVEKPASTNPDSRVEETTAFKKEEPAGRVRRSQQRTF